MSHPQPPDAADVAVTEADSRIDVLVWLLLGVVLVVAGLVSTVPLLIFLGLFVALPALVAWMTVIVSDHRARTSARRGQ